VNDNFYGDKLDPYQIIGRDFLAARRHAYLADEMGVGKTAQAIAAADLINAETIGVFCPGIARVNWTREFKNVSIYSPDVEIIRHEGQAPTQPYFTCSYDLASSLNKVFKKPIDLLILDEVHMLRSLGAARTQDILGKDGIIRRAKRVWNLSGSPAPNNYSELWSVLFTFGVTKLNYRAFIQKFCTYDHTGYGIKITGGKNVTELKRILKPFMLRRLQEEVFDNVVPVKISPYYVEPGHVDLENDNSFCKYNVPGRDYSEMFKKLDIQEKFMAQFFERMGTSIHCADIMENISKASNDSISTLRMYNGAQKVQPALEIIRAELEANMYQKKVIFGVHRTVIEGMKEGLKDFGAASIYGKTPDSKKQKHIDNFQCKKDRRVLVCNIQAANHAINLTAANHIDFVELDWVPMYNAQAIMRCRRRGQQKKCIYVRNILISNSVDSKIMKTLSMKTAALIRLFG